MRIAIDAMGGDHAPIAIVDGAVAAARELGIAVLLFGDRAKLEPALADRPLDGLSVEIRHAPDAIGMDESPTGALRRSESSLYRSFTACRDGDAAGVVFAGNTGAGMVLGAHVLGRVPGVERPAIAVLVPRQHGRTILLDAGANVDCRPIHLAQFAVMGDAYARADGEVTAPRVGLLSNGLEATKGNELTRSVAPLVRQLPINFVGYVEGSEVTSGAIDVAVCDGFVGNLILKSLEGLGRLINGRMHDLFAANRRTKLAYLMVRHHLGPLRTELDSREAGGALLIGLNGIAVKAHGSSDGRAIRSAIALAARLAQQDVARLIGEGIGATVTPETIEPRRARRLWQSIRGRIVASPPAGDAPAEQNGASPPRPHKLQGYTPIPSEDPSRPSDPPAKK
jgi:glycerol-3-phosphate acyltransferase PlsX